MLDAERAFEKLQSEYDAAVSEDTQNSDPSTFSAILYHRMIAQKEFENAWDAFKKVIGSPLPGKLSTEVLSVIETDFSEDDWPFIKDALAEMSGKVAGWKDRGDLAERVCLSVLQLAAGNCSLFDQYVESAILDWRDVILWAEYPRRTQRDA
ncbi:hypothetical protein [Symmachiella dynata]|uniref:hypothetical protein n=1 Tax=Symmachiella dynata TaxID=2527995 RepID=UPI0030EE933D